MYSRSKTIARLINSLSQLSCQQSTGDILITASKLDGYNGLEFTSKLRKLKQTTLQKLLPKGVSVVTRSDSGRVHCHIAAELPDKCIDFNWTAFEESERYYKIYKDTKDRKALEFYRYFTAKYRRSMPASWQSINRKLMIAGKKYGLGRIFLIPIRKNMKAYQWYLVGNVPYKRDQRDGKLKYVNSWGMPKTSKFQVINKFTTDYRNRLKYFCQGLQLTSENYSIVLRNVLGQSWYYRTSDIIKHIYHLPLDLNVKYNEIKNSIRIHLLRLNEPQLIL